MLTRVEVINHSSNKDNEFGRCFVHWDDKTTITLEVQDDGRTLKIFINDKQTPRRKTSNKEKAQLYSQV